MSHVKNYVFTFVELQENTVVSEFFRVENPILIKIRHLCVLNDGPSIKNVQYNIVFEYTVPV